MIGSVFEWIFLRHIEGDSFQTRKVMFNTKSSSPHPPRLRILNSKTSRTLLQWTHRSGLGLGNQIPSHHGGLDGTLLNGGWLLETVRVDTTEEFLGKVHAVKGFNGLVPVGLQIGIGQTAGGSLSASFLGRRSFSGRGFAVMKEKILSACFVWQKVALPGSL